MPLEEMCALLERHARPDLSTAIDGVQACRFDHTSPPVSGISGKVLAVITQGGKRLALGERLYEYRPGQYLVASVDLPVTGQVMDTGRPTLGFGMTLHPADIAALLLEAAPHDLPESGCVPQPGIAVTDAPAEHWTPSCACCAFWTVPVTARSSHQ
jgi:hypothetical protein